MWLLYVLIGYLVICLLLYLVQEKFLFHPEKLPPDFEFRYQQEFEELNFSIDEGVRINGLYFKVENPKGLVFYLHGNTRSIKGWAKYATDFLELGYEVIMVDYRGFGKSTGKRSERHIKNDMLAVYHELVNRFPEEKMIIYGRSMGTGFAAKIASQHSPRLLILNAPYYSMTDVSRRFLFFIPFALLLRYKIRTYVWMRYIRVPVHIIHGTKDRLIPFGSGLRLSKTPGIKAYHYPVVGAGHHDITNFPAYRESLEKILAS